MLSGDLKAVDAELGRARDLLARDGDTTDLSPHYSGALFELQVAHTLCLVGQADKALDAYERWLTPETFSRRDYGFLLSSKSAAQAQAGDVDSAAMTGLDALTIARATRSARTHAAVLRLVGELRPHWDRPQVRALRDEVVA